MPSLLLPFTAIGLAAGWLVADLLAHPAVHRLPLDRRGPAALAAGVVGGLLGIALGRLAGPDTARAAPWRTRLRFGGVTLAVGAGAGLAAVPSPSGALAGALAALAFLPVCAAVLAAARRAARARLGSIIAGADRRAIWVILAATLAATTVVAALDWPAASAGDAAPPHVALGLAAGAGALIAALAAVDVLALFRVARARASEPTLAPRPADEPALVDTRVPQLDMGLGGRVRARLSRNAAAYRYQARVVGLVVGSHARARTALVHALTRSAFALAIVGASLAVHHVAAGPHGGPAMRRVACSLGDDLTCLWVQQGPGCEVGTGGACRALAERYDREGERVYDPGRALYLLERGCAMGDERSCDELPSESIRASVRGCMRGSPGECALAADAFARVKEPFREAYFARRACRLGDVASCVRPL